MNELATMRLAQQALMQWLLPKELDQDSVQKADFSSLHRQLKPVLSASQEMELLCLEQNVLEQLRASRKFRPFLGPLCFPTRISFLGLLEPSTTHLGA